MRFSRAIPRIPRSLLTVTVLLAAVSVPVRGAGPRWVTGPPYFVVPAGQPVVWSTTSLLYFTDPADLSPYVTHAQADSLVAAAASVWNVPTSAIALGPGGTLAERVSSANSSMASTGPIFPADAQSSAYATRPIAVLYDTDGSIVDMMLGPGASDPTQCRQNGVLEDVDSITPFGSIQHAVLVLNGRCTGPAPEQQLQLQYQLQRAFGRILGLAWSQVNDNVFTGTPAPTQDQLLHWPILHPIDRVCGPYTYQCLPQPFTLRDDDVAAISSLYPVAAPAPPGKVPTWQNASRITGTISFPTGEGMQGVNVVVRRVPAGASAPEAFEDTSSVSGLLFQRNALNPVTGAPAGVSGSMGSSDPQLAGLYDLAWIPQPVPGNGAIAAVVTTQPVNPLYIGAYAVGPYVLGAVAPSGSPQSASIQAQLYDGVHPAVLDFAPPDASSSCAPADGTEFAPAAVPATGFWSSLLCGHGHAPWSTLNLAASRTATVEVTATDETGAPTTTKAMPVLGAWLSSDLMGTPPTLGATPSALNTIALGVSALHLYSGSSTPIRFAIADARGDGRPDFTYRARVLYAASIQPATLPLSGGQIAIAGMGFTPNLTVRINGVLATVLQATSTTLVVNAPASVSASTVDVTITDPATGGSTSLLSALTYSASPPADRMTLVSAPSGTVTVGVPAPVPFAVRVLQPDGVTPAAGVAVTFSLVSGSAQFATCSAATCIVLTDASGLASTPVTPTAAGSITLLAAVTGASQSITFAAALRTLTAVRPVQYVPAVAAVSLTVQVLATQDGNAATAMSIVWTSSPSFTLSSPVTLTDAAGLAQSAATIGPLAPGSSATAQACAWVTICASLSVISVDPALWRVEPVSGVSQSILPPAPLLPVVVRVTDVAGHWIAGAPVVIHQAITAPSPPCPTRGACPVAAVLQTQVTAAISDPDGLVTLTPMQPPAAGATHIVVAAGTYGFLAVSLAGD